MPCYDPRDSASYIRETELEPLRDQLHQSRKRNTQMTRILCAIGHILEESATVNSTHDKIMRVPGFKDWWEEHKRVDAFTAAIRKKTKK